ncbi:hypothetical protein F53441_14106 [Fusarium austroafricanum]|uniref:Uncharacterized protein n=1 Tax=Fusarium austroafricanum TaxID=2364996 RepID=A0A8H4NGG6_9HYPO|nr:hypothetical protein F53441_14106 [Fusarium austroafricanum]
MKLSTIVASTVLAMSASAKSPLPPAKPAKPVLVGAVYSDYKCGSSSQVSKWTITDSGVDRCVMFDQELGIDDYTVKSLKVNEINNPNCGLWVYSDYGCHMNAYRVEPDKCTVNTSNNFGWRSYAFFCLED